MSRRPVHERGEDRWGEAPASQRSRVGSVGGGAAPRSGMLWVGGGLLLALFWLLASLAAPAPALAQGGSAPVVTLWVRTLTSGGFVTNTSVVNGVPLVDVVNGDRVEYEVRLQNPANGTSLTNVRFEDVLPSNKLDSVECPQCSQVKQSSSTRTNALGEIETISVTRELVWQIGQVAPGQTATASFSARVVAQAGGASVDNTVLAFFTAQDGVASNKIQLNVLADIPTSPPANEDSLVSNKPAWFSSDQGGTLDMDWGDFDRDGYLDVALASTTGVTVYKNKKGQLSLFWTEPRKRPAYGLRWADVDGDSRPELIVVGDDTKNYVYRFNPTAGQTQNAFTIPVSGTFATTDQLARIQVGDFTGDNRPDLVLSTNSINAACPVIMIPLATAGLYSDSGAPPCVSSAASAAMAPADADGDGKLDLALGIFPNQIRVFLNEAVQFTQTMTNTVLVDSPGYFLPYDFAWGDVDGDGRLDLAAAFPLQREVRVYRNLPDGGKPRFQSFQSILRTDTFLTPHAIDLVDVNRDGRLDLVVADARPTIYWNSGDAQNPFSLNNRSPIPVLEARSEVWRIRGVDQDGNGVPEVSVANRSGPSILLGNYAPLLDTTMTPIVDSGRRQQCDLGRCGQQRVGRPGLWLTPQSQPEPPVLQSERPVRLWQLRGVRRRRDRRTGRRHRRPRRQRAARRVGGRAG